MARSIFPMSARRNDFPTWVLRPLRTFLAVPLRQQGELIGTLNARRTEVRPFTPAQIKLLETFADQAVIAIENVRLVQGTRERNAELREALEHQTATAEVLGIISRSPTDVQPVLDAIVESAARVCGIDDVVLRLREGNEYGYAGSFWFRSDAAASRSVSMSTVSRWMREQGTLHIPDVRARTISRSGFRAVAHASYSFPFASKANPLDALSARRIEVRPFTPAQIKLLETFADQAVIAIENVRLFKELRA